MKLIINRGTNNLIKITLIILLIISLFNMNYSFYEITRFIGMTLFVLLGIYENQKNNKLLMIIWFSAALILNPYIKLQLEKDLWVIVNIILILIIVATFINESINNRIKFDSLDEIFKSKLKKRLFFLLFVWFIGGLVISFYLRPKSLNNYMIEYRLSNSYATEIINSKENESIIALLSTFSGSFLILYLIRKKYN